MRTYKIKKTGDLAFARVWLIGKVVSPKAYKFSFIKKLKFLFGKGDLNMSGTSDFELDKVRLISDGKPTIEWVKE